MSNLQSNILHVQPFSTNVWTNIERFYASELDGILIALTLALWIDIEDSCVQISLNVQIAAELCIKDIRLIIGPTMVFCSNNQKSTMTPFNEIKLI